MAVTLEGTLGEAEAKEAMQKLENELLFVLDNADIPKALQAKMAAAGIVSCNIFSAIETEVEGLKDLSKADLGLDPKNGIGNKVTFAKLVNAWEACKVRGAKRKTKRPNKGSETCLCGFQSPPT